MIKVFLLIAGATSISAVATAQRAAVRDTAYARGVAYSVRMADQNPTRNGRISIAVECAAGRGRIDLTEKVSSPVVRLDGIAFSPSADVGDYYLFDSTAFILVRPAQHTFTPFRLARLIFNFNDGREGWPDSFPMSGFKVDTVPPATSPPLHGPITVLFHVNWGVPDVGILSRGVVNVADAPFGESVVARWFGPTFALAAYALLDSAGLTANQIGLTAVTPLRADSTVRDTYFVTLQRLVSVHIAAISRARLMLPSDYVEVPYVAGAKAGDVPPGEITKWHTRPW